MPVAACEWAIIAGVYFWLQVAFILCMCGHVQVLLLAVRAGDGGGYVVLALPSLPPSLVRSKPKVRQKESLLFFSP